MMQTSLFQQKISRRALGKRVAAAVAMAGIPGILAFAHPGEAGAVPLSGITGYVSSPDGVLNLRTGPATTYPIIRRLSNGQALSMIKTSSDWFQVIANGTYGWVNSWYVVLNGTPSRVISRGNTNRKMVALTFDAGSDLGYAERILNILGEYGIRASFGLTGDWMESYPDYAGWITGDRHQVLNHTLKHLSYTGVSTGSGPISPASRLAQLVANENRLRSITGVGATPYWRPPYGDYDWSVLRDVGAAGYSKTIMWGIDTMGWNGASADQIYSTVVNRVGWGTIVLMHVGSGSRDAAALERIIVTLRGRGYGFGTISQVIAA